MDEEGGEANSTMMLRDCWRCGAPLGAGQVVCERCGLDITRAARSRVSDFVTRRLSWFYAPAPERAGGPYLEPANTPKLRHDRAIPVGAAMFVLAVVAVALLYVGTNGGHAPVRVTSAQEPSSTVASAYHPAATATTPARLVLPQPTATQVPPTTVAVAAVQEPPAPSTAIPAPPTATPESPTPAPTVAQPEPPTPAPTVAQPAPPAQPAPAEQPVTTRVLHGMGSVAYNVDGWTIKLDGTATRRQLWSDGPYRIYRPSGTFWLVYLVYSNTSTQPRSLGAAAHFTLQDAQGNTYAEVTGHGTVPGLSKVPLAEGANALDFAVQPGNHTTTVLVFDLPPGVRPTQLVAGLSSKGAGAPDMQVVWELGK